MMSLVVSLMTRGSIGEPLQFHLLHLAFLASCLITNIFTFTIVDPISVP